MRIPMHVLNDRRWFPLKLSRVEVNGNWNKRAITTMTRTTITTRGGTLLYYKNYPLAPQRTFVLSITRSPVNCGKSSNCTRAPLTHCFLAKLRYGTSKRITACHMKGGEARAARLCELCGTPKANLARVPITKF